jgi:hypothetical protein
MKRYVLATLTGALLLSGCAADGTHAPDEASKAGNWEDPPLGSMIKRKPGTGGPQEARTVDPQAIQNVSTGPVVMKSGK